MNAPDIGFGVENFVETYDAYSLSSEKKVTVIELESEDSSSSDEAFDGSEGEEVGDLD